MYDGLMSQHVLMMMQLKILPHHIATPLIMSILNIVLLLSQMASHHVASDIYAVVDSWCWRYALIKKASVHQATLS